MSKEDSGFEWGKNISVNGQDIALEDSGSAWGGGITVGGESIEESSIGQTATINITYKTSIVRTIGGQNHVIIRKT